jgi:hypothetical protein
MNDLFRGQLVRLTSEEPEILARQEARWQRDSEFHRLADSDPADLYSERTKKERLDKQADDDFSPERVRFSIRALDGDVPIGFLGLWVKVTHREVWVGLGSATGRTGTRALGPMR